MPETKQAAETPPVEDAQAPPEAPPESTGTEERRSSVRDRRTAVQDRRDPERVAEDIAPRRHPEIKGRRKTDR
jgi:hypothetical protein